MFPLMHTSIAVVVFRFYTVAGLLLGLSVLHCSAEGQCSTGVHSGALSYTMVRGEFGLDGARGPAACSSRQELQHFPFYEAQDLGKRARASWLVPLLIPSLALMSA